MFITEIGRLIVASVSLRVSVTRSLNLVWLLALLLSVTWLIFVWYVELTRESLFVLGSITGLILSPILPLSFALINQRVNVRPVLLASLLAESAIGSVVFQKYAGEEQVRETTKARTSEFVSSGYLMDHQPSHFSSLFIVGILVSIVLHSLCHLIHVVDQRKRLIQARHPSTTYSWSRICMCPI